MELLLLFLSLEQRKSRHRYHKGTEIFLFVVIIFRKCHAYFFKKKSNTITSLINASLLHSSPFVWLKIQKILTHVSTRLCACWLYLLHIFISIAWIKCTHYVNGLMQWLKKWRIAIWLLENVAFEYLAPSFNFLSSKKIWEHTVEFVTLFCSWRTCKLSSTSKGYIWILLIWEQNLLKCVVQIR